MTHDEIRKHHFERLNNYRQSAEYAEYAKAIGAEVPPGELPSLIGNRWEIDAEVYQEFLEVLPPLGWRGNTFYLSEFTFADITTKFTKDGDKYFCEFARYPERQASHPVTSPWGKPDTIKEIAPGIIRYDTPSHGGYWLSPERVAEMPPCLREFKPFAGPNWYEEDADWSIVVLAFPQFFSPAAMQAALETLKHYKPEIYEQVGSKTTDAKQLTNKRLEAIWSELTRAGHASIADEMREHIAALEEKLEGREQYYEEFIIPEIEGRRVGKWSAGGGRRVGGPGERGV